MKIKNHETKSEKVSVQNSYKHPKGIYLHCECEHDSSNKNRRAHPD